MGCDIHGWVEVAPYSFSKDDWFATCNAGLILSRNYDLFGLLFDVRNYADFEPIAAEREMPSNISDTTKAELAYWGGDVHSHTYISYEEIKNIDPDQESRNCDERIHIYNIEGQYFGKASGIGSLDEIDLHILNKDGILNKNGNTYKLEKVKAKDALDDSRWISLVKIMDIFAELYGNENVRLVVWFDN